MADTSSKSFQCEYCDKEFKNNYMKVHLAAVHGHGKQFQCEECGDKFRTKAYYAIHHRIHTGERPYKCDKCDKDYRDACALNTHKVRSHKILPLINCTVCIKTFKTQKRLEHHMIIHSEGRQKPGPKKYSEIEKDQAYKLARDIGVTKASDQLKISYDTLRNWIKLKENGKNCNECRKSFPCRASLTRHMKSMHNDKIRKKGCRWTYSKEFREKVISYANEHGLERAVEKFNVPESTMRNWNCTVMCSFCGKLYSKKQSSLKLHLQKKHNSHISHLNSIELDNYVSSFSANSSTLNENDEIEKPDHNEKIIMDEKQSTMKYNFAETKTSEINEMEVKIELTPRQLDNHSDISGPKIEKETISKQFENDTIKNYQEGNPWNGNGNSVFNSEIIQEKKYLLNIYTSFYDTKQQDSSEVREHPGRNDTESRLEKRNVTFFWKIPRISSKIEKKEIKSAIFQEKNIQIRTENVAAIDIDKEIIEGTERKENKKQSWNRQDTVVINNHKIERNANGRFQCVLCSKDFRSPADIKRHYRLHTGEKNFKCSICFKAFVSAYNMKNHMATHEESHTLKIFKCSKCEKRFTTEKYLQIHSERLHENPGAFVCSVCSYSFNRKDNLAIHERKHSGVQPYSCNKCNKSFFEKRALDSHSYKDHGVSKPSICEICGKGFVLKSKLVDHMNIHKGTKQHECDQCEASFYLKGRLNDHKMRHKLKEGLYTGVSLLCCGEIYTSRKRQNLHFQVVHQKLKPFSCELCTKKFTREDSLRRHNKSHAKRFLKTCNQCDFTTNSIRGLKMHINQIHEIKLHKG